MSQRVRGIFFTGLIALALFSAPVSEPILAADSVVHLILHTDRPTYRAGDPVRFSLTVSNVADTPITFHCKDAQRFDVAISDSTGHEVWRWSADQMFAQMMSDDTLGPGESRNYRAQFTGHLQPGQYRASGTAVCVEPPLRAESVFTVRSR